MEKVKFIAIDVKARDRLGLSNDMYAIADSVYHLSNHSPQNPHPGWCDASKIYLGEHAGVSRATVFRHLRVLEEKKLIQRGVNGLFRTTEKWYNMVVIAKETRARLKKNISEVKEKSSHKEREKEAKK